MLCTAPPPLASSAPAPRVGSSVVPWPPVAGAAALGVGWLAAASARGAGPPSRPPVCPVRLAVWLRPCLGLRPPERRTGALSRCETLEQRPEPRSSQERRPRTIEGRAPTLFRLARACCETGAVWRCGGPAPRAPGACLVGPWGSPSALGGPLEGAGKAADRGPRGAPHRRRPSVLGPPASPSAAAGGGAPLSPSPSRQRGHPLPPGGGGAPPFP